jgi:dihydrofolate reductase
VWARSLIGIATGTSNSSVRIRGASFGLASAVAQAKAFAGEKNISITPGNVGGQAIAAGIVDEVCVDLVPVVFGSGIRYFGDYTGSPLLLENPEIVEGDRVTHLRYRIRRH